MGVGQTVRRCVVRELLAVVLPRSSVSVAEPEVAVDVFPNGKDMLQGAGGGWIASVGTFGRHQAVFEGEVLEVRSVVTDDADTVIADPQVALAVGIE